MKPFQNQWQSAPYLIQLKDRDAFQIAVSGRLRWALEQLVAAGPRGCTTDTHPAPRWAGYVHKLRFLGVPILTRMEANSGPFTGHHARYELAATVTAVEEEAA